VLSDLLLQTVIVGLALSGAAAISGFLLWRTDRQSYILLWALAWTADGARWLLHYRAMGDINLYTAEIAMLALGAGFALLGATEAVPALAGRARRGAPWLAALLLLTLAAGLATGHAPAFLHVLAFAQGLVAAALIVRAWRTTQQPGYLVLAVMGPLWVAANLAGMYWYGEQWRQVPVYPMVALPMLMGFLLVIFGQARQRALDAERKLGRIFDTAPVPLVVARHPHGEAEQFNQAMLDLSGLTAEELRGHTGREHNVIAERDKVREIFGELREGRSVTGRELDYVFPSGPRRVAINASTVQLEDGLRYIFALHDLTRERDLERQARATLARFTALFETNPVGIALVDVATNRIVAINDAALQIAGISLQHAQQTPADKVLNWLNQETTGERHAALMRGERLANVPDAFTRPDGRVVHVLISGQLTEIEGRDQLMLTYHDVTVQRRAEVAVQQINAELEARVANRTTLLRQANADLESFSYTVAHDLRAPLRAITGFAGILAEDAGPRLNADDRSHLARISAAALRMSGLLDGLLDFARTGRAQLQKTGVDMRALAAEAIAENAEAAGGQVRVTLGELPPARGDALLLRQVWRNLVDNACKFSRKSAEPRVEVGCNLVYPGSGAPPVAEYYVRDNGVGFDMDHAGRLFGVFQRLHDAADFTGTGVGLAIAQRIVMRHGGAIRAQSAPGQGATFSFTLGQE
jgi:PAS domain S-box-containing protein